MEMLYFLETRLTLNGLHDIISQKTAALFILIAFVWRDWENSNRFVTIASVSVEIRTEESLERGRLTDLLSGIYFVHT
jgi:hypothetical protein